MASFTVSLLGHLEGCIELVSRLRRILRGLISGITDRLKMPLVGFPSVVFCTIMLLSTDGGIANVFDTKTTATIKRSNGNRFRAITSANGFLRSMEGLSNYLKHETTFYT